MPLNLESKFYQRLEGSQKREFSESVSFFHLVVSVPKKQAADQHFFLFYSHLKKKNKNCRLCLSFGPVISSWPTAIKHKTASRWSFQAVAVLKFHLPSPFWRSPFKTNDSLDWSGEQKRTIGSGLCQELHKAATSPSKGTRTKSRTEIKRCLCEI